MPFLQDITYDEIYDISTTLSRIIYQSDGQHPSIAIQFNTTEPFSFIRFFGNAIECRNYIRLNRQKQFTLFCSSVNVIGLRDLLADQHLRDIHIFCMLPNHRQFLSRYLARVNHKIRNIFMYDRLEYELLLFGVEYCRKVADEIEQEDRSIADMALRDGQRLSQALADYFTRRIENCQENPPEQSTT